MNSAPEPRRGWNIRRKGVVIAVGVVIVLAAAFVYTNVRISQRPATSAAQATKIAQQQAGAAVSQLQSAQPTGETVYGDAASGLVLIQARHGGPSKLEDLGTGFIIDAQGDIMTALHVVAGATSIKVTFSDGTSARAVVVTGSSADDIAELVTNHSTMAYTPEVFGGGAAIGDPVYAVGNPIGLVGSLSAGVISGFDRTFRSCMVGLCEDSSNSTQQ